MAFICLFVCIDTIKILKWQGFPIVILIFLFWGTVVLSADRGAYDGIWKCGSVCPESVYSKKYFSLSYL